jgi:hypothetical protein
MEPLRDRVQHRKDGKLTLPQNPDTELDPFRLRPLPGEDVFFFLKKIDNSRLSTAPKAPDSLNFIQNAWPFVIDGALARLLLHSCIFAIVLMYALSNALLLGRPEGRVSFECAVLTTALMIGVPMLRRQVLVHSKLAVGSASIPEIENPAIAGREKDIVENLLVGISRARAIELLLSDPRAMDCKLGSEEPFWTTADLEQLRSHLTDPITPEQAVALRAIVVQLVSVKDVIRWLEGPSMSWDSYQATNLVPRVQEPPNLAQRARTGTGGKIKEALKKLGLRRSA